MFNLPAFLIYIVVTSFTPGPNNIMSMSNAVRFGFKKSFPFNLGVFAGIGIVAPVCAIFSMTLLQYVPKVKTVMLFVGAGYMLYLAWKTWRHMSDVEMKDTKGSSFWAGMLLQLANPKLFIYSITSMSVYILPFYQSPWALFWFSLLLAFVGFAGTIFWAFGGAIFCKILAKHGKIVGAVMALLLVYCAVSLFF